MRELLTLTAGTSDKFWLIDVTECDVTVQYGRRGTKGVTKTTGFGTPAEAKEAAAKQLRAKLAMGYVRSEALAAAEATPSAGADTSSGRRTSTHDGPDEDERVEAQGPPAESAPRSKAALSACGDNVGGRPPTPAACDDLERDDVGLVGGSPFTDAYRIENLPVTTCATSTPSIDDERKRFEVIAHGVPTQTFTARTAQWVFRDPPFVEIPTSEVAQAWWEWVSAAPLPGREVGDLAGGEVLVPIFVALRGIEWLLELESGHPLWSYAMRPLLPLVSGDLAGQLEERAKASLPALMIGSSHEPNREFVSAGVVRGGDADVVAALDAWEPAEPYERSVSDHIGHALLYPTVGQRVAAMVRWRALFRDGPGTHDALRAWLYATGRDGFRVVLESLDGVAAAVAEGMLEVAAAMMTGPGATELFIDALTRNGAAAARAWLSEHLDVCVLADLDATRARALAPFLREVPTAQLVAARGHAVAAVVRVIDSVLSERDVADVASPALASLDGGSTASSEMRALARRLPPVRLGDGRMSLDDTAPGSGITGQGAGRWPRCRTRRVGRRQRRRLRHGASAGMALPGRPGEVQLDAGRGSSAGRAAARDLPRAARGAVGRHEVSPREAGR